MSGKKGNPILTVMVVVVAVVLALGVYAVYGTLEDSFAQKKASEMSAKVQSGQATVGELADASGMTVDELLASYDLTKEDAVSANDNMLAMADKLTLENYCRFTGLEFSESALDEYKAMNGFGDEVNKDTKDPEIRSGFAAYLYGKQQGAQAEAMPIEAVPAE